MLGSSGRFEAPELEDAWNMLGSSGRFGAPELEGIWKMIIDTADFPRLQCLKLWATEEGTYQDVHACMYRFDVT